MQSAIFLETVSPVFTIPTTAIGSTIAYTVTDYSGVTILQGQVAVTSRQTTLPLQRLPNNYYVLKMTDHTTPATTTWTLPFTVVAPFSPAANAPFAVGAHFSMHDPFDVVEPIVTMGVRSVRDDATWAKIETKKGIYSFESTDPFMQVLRQNALVPLLILDYNNSFYDNGQTPYDESGFTAFANYAKALVSHYGPQLKAVEVYNEYNFTFSNGPCARQASCYAQLLRFTYQAIKSVRPDVTVVAGATFGIDLDWFKDLFAAGGLSFADAISIHPYSILFVDSPEVRRIAENIQALQGLIQSHNHGETKPIWITEIGWSTALNFPTEAQQAHYLVRSAALSLSVGVEKIFWYDFLNDGTEFLDKEQNFGLLRRPDALGYYTPKPAYTAYAVLIRAVAGRTFIRRESEAPGISHMRFSDHLHLLWSTPLEQSIVLSATSPVTMMTMTGKKQTLLPEGGQITLDLSAEPVYLLGDVVGETPR
jgi:Glycosyl hydrolase catalytic core